MKNKIALLSLLFFLSAGCGVLGNAGPTGVVKTVDGGGVWQTKNRIEGSNGEISGLRVYEMTFDPNNHEHIYMSTTEGFWRSDNSADTWKQILAKVVTYDFHLNPQDTNNIFVAGIFGEHGKIIRTKDGGTTWEEIYNEASTNNPVNTITANPNNQLEIYAALASGTVIKSIDGGNNWFVVGDLKGEVLRLRYSKLNNSLYAFVTNGGLSKSTDGGITWNSITNGLTGAGQSSFIPERVDRFIKLGLDDQSAGVIYITTSKGLYKTTNDGQNWSLINLPVKTDSDKPRAIASTKGGMIAYTSIGGTIFKTLDGGKSWQTQGIPSDNPVNKILIDPVLQQITYAGLTQR
jgi:photosystem II stability/assembly factor-like uncharacterized protein